MEGAGSLDQMQLAAANGKGDPSAAYSFPR